MSTGLSKETPDQCNNVEPLPEVKDDVFTPDHVTPVDTGCVSSDSSSWWTSSQVSYSQCMVSVCVVWQLTSWQVSYSQCVCHLTAHIMTGELQSVCVSSDSSHHDRWVTVSVCVVLTVTHLSWCELSDDTHTDCNSPVMMWAVRRHTHWL